jgi:uncharacterized protein involved in exopolysaccharide biosynthesis
VNTSGRVEKLRDRISQLKEKRDALLVIYKPEWPEVKKIDAQIQELEAELKQAPAEIVTSIQRRYEALWHERISCDGRTNNKRPPRHSRRVTRSICWQ